MCFIAPSVAPFHHFANEADIIVTSINLASPSFSPYRWMGGYQMVSESIQAVQDKDRLLLKSLHRHKLT